MYNVPMKTSTLTLTHEQASKILQALLFSASADICADWGNDDSEEMLAVAKAVMAQCYLSDEKPDLKKIYLFGGIPYEQHLSESLEEDFGLKVQTT
jgi:hypothetical protein